MERIIKMFDLEIVICIDNGGMEIVFLIKTIPKMQK